MKIYNTLSHKVEELVPLKDKHISIYSCGPTVYDHIHIGNLSSFIFADTLHRALKISGYKIHHVMNFTDVDDKTIARSIEKYPDITPEEALTKLTREYEQIFISDMETIGNSIDSLQFIKATETLDAIRQLITQLHADGFAYITEDGVYFSIEKYKNSGKTYGQLLTINSDNTASSRIDNDEYDKESAHDFALWKTKKSNEPGWDFELGGKNILGRPGWHIECSAMSKSTLGQPFDIHTGGVDLIFPHHENEIAQSTAGNKNPVYAKYFVHNEHLLVDGKKMSKSLNNFFTLRDIQEKGYDPMAFRLMVLQSHYRNQSNFSWENLEASKNALSNFYAWADLQFQSFKSEKLANNYSEALILLKKEMIDDLKTPAALAIFNGMVNRTDDLGIDTDAITNALVFIDSLFGLGLSKRIDITPEQKKMLNERLSFRENNDWSKSDNLRDELKQQGIGVRDSDHGQIWYRRASRTSQPATPPQNDQGHLGDPVIQQN